VLGAVKKGGRSGCTRRETQRARKPADHQRGARIAGLLGAFAVEGKKALVHDDGARRREQRDVEKGGEDTPVDRRSVRGGKRGKKIFGGEGGEGPWKYP